MPLDIEAKRRRTLELLDAYSALLTEHQRETLRLHLAQDWSYAEIAKVQGVSRTAVYDLVRRAVGALEAYEVKLKLVANAERRSDDRGALETRLDAVQAELGLLRRSVKGLD